MTADPGTPYAPELLATLQASLDAHGVPCSRVLVNPTGELIIIEVPTDDGITDGDPDAGKGLYLGLRASLAGLGFDPRRVTRTVPGFQPVHPSSRVLAGYTGPGPDAAAIAPAVARRARRMIGWHVNGQISFETTVAELLKLPPIRQPEPPADAQPGEGTLAFRGAIAEVTDARRRGELTGEQAAEAIARLREAGHES